MDLSRTTRRLTAVTALAVAASALLPAGASAISTTVTADDGTPVPLNGAVLRGMSPKVGISLDAGERRNFSATFIGPDGVNVAATESCRSSPLTRTIDFRGNGAYTVTVTPFGDRDFSCAQAPAGPAVSSSFTIASAVALAGPPGPVLTRAPNSFTTNVVALGFDPNPGALSHEIRYASNAVLGPDGAISGPSEDAFADPTTGTVPLRLRTPGTYTVVARAKGFSGSGGQFFSAWSAPVTVRALAPFDLARSRFSDARGPSYAISAQLGEQSARGRVRIAYARGTRGGRYRSLGSARLTSKGSLQHRFRLTRPGTYRMRLTFAGSETVAPGSVVQRFRISRRVVFG